MNLKRLKDLTDEEILNLTKQDYELYLHREYAIAGIKIVEKPELVENSINVSKYTEIAYEINHLDIISKDKSVLEEIVNFILSKYDDAPTDFCRGNYVEYKVRHKKELMRDELQSYISIERINLFTDNKSKCAYEKEKELYEKRKEDYSNQLDEYNDYKKQVAIIKDEFDYTINSITDKYRKFNNLYDDYLYYLKLSDNNPEIAWKFLKGIKDVTIEAENYINNKIKERNNVEETIQDKEEQDNS